MNSPSTISISYLAHSARISSLRSTVAEQPEGFPPIGLVLTISMQPPQRDRDKLTR